MIAEAAKILMCCWTLRQREAAYLAAPLIGACPSQPRSSHSRCQYLHTDLWLLQVNSDSSRAKAAGKYCIRQLQNAGIWHVQDPHLQERHAHPCRLDEALRGLPEWWPREPQQVQHQRKVQGWPGAPGQVLGPLRVVLQVWHHWWWALRCGMAASSLHVMVVQEWRACMPSTMQPCNNTNPWAAGI